MSRSARMVGAALIPAFALPFATANVARAAVPDPPRNSNLPSGLDIASPYVPQSTCDPTAKPGVTAFARLMANHYNEFSYGISRECDQGLTEHSEGRALDWMLDAYDTHERAVADSVISWLLAPDDQGRPAAMARRFGIMYIIWNNQIWGTYEMDAGWRPYNGASPHTDHIHFSFSWDGAMQRTSWWTGKPWTEVSRGPGGPTVPVTPPSSYPTLKEGASGPDVVLAQEVLGVTADGVFGPGTKAALLEWQEKNGVKATGVLDKATWNTMVELGDIADRGDSDKPKKHDSVRRGSTGESVKELQRLLKLPVDGSFGPATDKAVRKFQEEKSLKVDGHVTANVWKALLGEKYEKTGEKAKPKPEPKPDPDAIPSSVRLGSSGAAVKELQRILKVTVDGEFGPDTEKAVRAFQKENSLTVDGNVTSNVWKALKGQKYEKTAPKPKPKPEKTPEPKPEKTPEPKPSESEESKKPTPEKDDEPEPQKTPEPTPSESKEPKPAKTTEPKPERTDEAEKPKTSTPSPAASTVKTSTEFTPLKDKVLAEGARDEGVKSVQRAVGGVAVDGSYGGTTTKAVRGFQRSSGLEPTGIVDEKTWDALEEKKYPFLKYRTTVLKPGSTGPAVEALQTYLNLPADGVYDDETEQAVKTVQKQHGLTRTGYVGAVTWEALEREVRIRR